MESAYATELPVRYRDLDPADHVNNAVYATYVEEGRTAYARDVLGVDLAAEQVVIAALSVEFERPVEAGDGPVEVAVAVPDLGESSLPMRYELRTDRVVATAETTMVTVDGEKRPRPLPPAWRERIAAHEPHL